jgi:hypothetical protein
MEQSFEKLIVAYLVKKFTAFYGTGRFSTVFTRARRRILSYLVFSHVYYKYGPVEIFMFILHNNN